MSAQDDELLLRQLGARARAELASAEELQGVDVDSELLARRVLQSQAQRTQRQSFWERFRLRLRGWPGVLIGTAVAASFCLVPVLDSWQERSTSSSGSESLPNYQLSVQRARADWRAAASDVHDELSGGGEAVLLLRPAAGTAVAPEVGIWLDDGANLRELEVDVERDESGSIRLRFGVPAAVGRIVLVLATRALLEGSGPTLVRERTERGPDWQRWSLPIRTGP
jgi:hypothetical protein